MQHELQLDDGSAVLIRPYQPDDVPLLYEAVRESINEVAPWLPWCHPDYALEESRGWIETRAEARAQGTEYDFAMIDTARGRLLGGCGINALNRANRFANLGYWVRTSRTRRGVATAAARCLAAFGFRELGLIRIEIVIATANTASQRVAEKLGATREGVLRNRILVRDRVHDAVMFSLIPSDRIESG